MLENRYPPKEQMPDQSTPHNVTDEENLLKPGKPVWVRPATLLVLALAGLWAVLHCAAPSQSAKPERIILIVVDMLRRDHVGVYGDRAETPHIDRLAAEGQVAQNAIASFPSTTMSMGALFTGLTPSIESGDVASGLPWTSKTWCGLARLASPGSESCIPDGVPTLAERLREAGFETIGVTSNLLLYQPAGFEKGFDIWEEAGAEQASPEASEATESRISQGKYGGTSADSVIAAVRFALSQRTRDRFFLYAHFMDVHDFKLAGISYPDGVNRADAGVGQLLELLEEKGLLENSLVVLTSDHGERLGERHPVEGLDQHFGNPAFDYLLRVPLISAPGLLKNPASVARGQDLASLILARAGVVSEAPAPVQPADEVFLSEWEWQTLRSGRWKAAFRRDGTRALLFDLKEDAGETSDLSLEHPEILKRMRDRLSELTQEFSAASAQGRMSPEDIKRLRAIGYIEALNAAGPQAPE